MGTRHLHEILSERQTISGTMQVRFDIDTMDHISIKFNKIYEFPFSGAIRRGDRSMGY